MSVASTTVEVTEAGNGSKYEFDFAFKIFAASDLVVRRQNAEGVWSDPLTLNVDYTVAFDTTAETGTVSYQQEDPENPGSYIAWPVDDGGKSWIGRSLALTQSTHYVREGATPARTQENIVDRLTLLVQQTQAVLSRCLVQSEIPPSPEPISVDPPEDTKGLKYQDNGDGTWTIIPSTYDPDDQIDLAAAQAAIATAQAAVATAQAVAAAASAVAAAASAAIVADAISSGLYAARPAAPTSIAYYYSTDRGSLELWIPAAARWFLIG